MAVTYFNLLMTLEESRAQLRRVAVPTSDAGLGEWLRERRVPEHHAADAACEEFAMTEGWPPIRTDSVVAQVHLRVTAAAQLCRSMVDRPVPAGLTRRQALRALLLDYWHGRVARWMGGLEGEGKGLGLATEDDHGQGEGAKGAAGAGFNMTVAE